MLENTIKIRCLSFDLVKISCEGKFERLITKIKSGSKVSNEFGQQTAVSY